MGIPKRHVGAPHRGGELLTGPNLETDILNLIFEYGLSGETEGFLDNSNFAPEADIQGAKFLDGSMNTAQFKPNSIDGDKLQTSVLTAAKILDGTLTTEKFKDGEFYNTVRGDSSAVPYTTTATPTDVVTAPVTTGPATSTVLIIAWLEVAQVVAIGSEDLSIRLRRDSTTLRTLDNIDVGGQHTMAFIFPWLDTGHTADTPHTYALQAEETGAGSGAFIIHGAFMNLIELRR